MSQKKIMMLLYKPVKNRILKNFTLIPSYSVVNQIIFVRLFLRTGRKKMIGNIFLISQIFYQMSLKKFSGIYLAKKKVYSVYASFFFLKKIVILIKNFYVTMRRYLYCGKIDLDVKDGSDVL